MIALPPLLVLTDGRQAADAGHDLRDMLAAVMEAGGDALGVIVRERDLPGGTAPPSWTGPVSRARRAALS